MEILSMVLSVTRREVVRVNLAKIATPCTPVSPLDSLVYIINDIARRYGLVVKNRWCEPSFSHRENIITA